MTREENLHWIDQEIQTWENECQSKHPIKEALYAARKALEQEPTTKNNRGVDCSLDDFIKYCKRTFGVELTVKKSDNPDTYAKLFGTSKNDLGVDCISRQAVIEFVCKNTKEILKDTMPLEVKLSDDYLYENIAKIMRNPKVLPSVTPQEPNTWSLDDAREDFMYDVYNELDFLPTNDEANRIIDSFDMVTKGIKQEPRWIPVSERLPTRKEYIANNGRFIVSDGERSYSEYFDIYDKECFGEPTMYGFRIDRAVAAWMPLPKPYKAESEEV